MKTIFKLLPVLILLLVSCSKKEGCKDPEALNFDSTAEKDGTCSYSKVIFYAPSNKVGGTADLVEKIEVFLGPTPGEQLIGTITTFDHPVPSDCSPPSGSIAFELPGSGVDYIFITRFYYENGSNESGETYTFKAINSKACYTENLTLD